MRIIKRLGFSLLVLVFLSSALNVALLAQEKPQSEEEQKMMKLWQEYATPGDNHKFLEYFAGTWETHSTMWMSAGDKPMVSKGETKAKMIFGGRYLKAHYKGLMMGMPFEGLSLSGYDNFLKKFQTIWFDNAGTGFYKTSGTLDKTKKIKIETGLFDDFMSGGKSKVRWVTTIIDDNKYKFEMYAQDYKTGKEYKNGEIIYTRKK